MKQNFAKFLTLLLAAAMIFGSTAISAFADEADTTAEIMEEYFADPADEDEEQGCDEEQPEETDLVRVSETIPEDDPDSDENAELPAADSPAEETDDTVYSSADDETDSDDVSSGLTEKEEDEDISDIYTDPDLEEVYAAPLDTPVITSVKNTAEGTRIIWDEVKNAEKYQIYRKNEGSSQSWDLIGETEEISFTDAESANGTGYYYTVKAVVDGDSSKDSDYAVSVFNVNIGMVTLKSCDADANGITVSWNGRSGATRYVVYRKTGASGDWARLAAVAATSYVDTTAVNGKTYYYTVSAYKTSGGVNYYGAHETPGLSCTRLAAPKLTTTTSSSNGIKVYWNAVNGAESYRVYRKTAGSGWSVLGNTTGTYYNDKTAKAGTVYYYTVRAYAGDSRSNYESGIKGYTLNKVNLKSAYNVNGGITVTWTALSAAQGYFVYRRTDSEKDWTRIGTVTGTTFTDTKAPAGTVYYTVRAYRTVDGVKYNGMFDPDGIGVENVPAPVLGTVSVNKNARSITINWGAVSGAAKYIVYRRSGTNSGWSRLATVTGRTYTDTSLNTSLDYYYTVRAVSASGTVSGYDSAGLCASFNPIPVLVSAVSNPSGIEVKWQAYPGAEGYYVYRKVGNAASWTRIATTTKTSYLDINAKAGMNNTYTVRAYYHSNGTLKKSGYNKTGITCRFTDTVRISIAQRMSQLGINSLLSAYYYATNISFKSYQNEQTAVWYVKTGLANNTADCHIKAALFCWMARELGYEAYVVDGYVVRATGTLGVHGWAEVIINGSTYVVDPEFQYRYPEYNGYMFTYGTKNTWQYRNWHTMADY